MGAAAQRYLHKWISPSQTTLIHPLFPHCLSDITYFVFGEIWRFSFLYWLVCYSLLIKKRLCSKKANDEIMSLFDKESTSKTYPYEVLIYVLIKKSGVFDGLRVWLIANWTVKVCQMFLFCRFGCNQQKDEKPWKWCSHTNVLEQYVRTHMTIEE